MHFDCWSSEHQSVFIPIRVSTAEGCFRSRLSTSQVNSPSITPNSCQFVVLWPLDLGIFNWCFRSKVIKPSIFVYICETPSWTPLVKLSTQGHRRWCVCVCLGELAETRPMCLPLQCFFFSLCQSVFGADWEKWCEVRAGVMNVWASGSLSGWNAFTQRIYS